MVLFAREITHSSSWTRTISEFAKVLKFMLETGLILKQLHKVLFKLLPHKVLFKLSQGGSSFLSNL